MLDTHSQPAPAFAGETPRPFAVEAHFYSGGRRVQLLGRDATRPAWVPPDDWVGLRNEIAMERGDYVVEFARFLFSGRRVTWIGLFKHAVDEVYGDRQNHAGVGVWLLEHDLVHAGSLLNALSKLAGSLGGDDDPTLSSNADLLLSRDFLPAYVTPTPDFPAPLAGWHYAPSQLADTAQFLAAAPVPDEAWELAAEQLLRATILRPSAPSLARQLILVRQREAAVGDEPSGMVRLKPGLATDIVRALPAALQDFSEEGRRVRAEAEQLAARCHGLESALAEQRGIADRLSNQLPILQVELDAARAQLEGNDSYRQWAQVRDAMRDIADQGRRNENLIEVSRRDILNRIASLPSSSAASLQQLSGLDAASRSASSSGSNRFGRHPDAGAGRWLLWGLWILVGLLAVAVIYFAYSYLSAPADAPIAPEARWSERSP
jgi:hypothetical protein